VARVEATAGTTIEELKRTRVIPDAQAPPDTAGMDIWSYQDTIKPEEWATRNVHTVIYRWRENGEKVYVSKYYEPITEDMIQKNHGGGTYKLMMKRGPQLVKTVDRLQIEGPPLPLQAIPATTSNANGNNTSDNGSISRLCDLLEKVLLNQTGKPLVEEGFRQALGLQGEVFKTGVDAVRSTLNGSGVAPAAPAPDPMRDMMTSFMQAAIARMLNPTDPIETFSKMATAVKALGIDAGGNSSVGVELIRALPQVAQHVAQSMQAYSQAQLAAAAAAAAPRPALPAPGAPAQPAPGTAPQPASPSAPTEKSDAPKRGQEPVVAAPNVEWIETKMVEILMRDQSVTDAASEALGFLQVASVQIRDQLLAAGEAGITWLFNNRPILMQVPKNPRLSEFIAKFLELGNGGEAIPQEPAAPAAPEPAAS
jgi:hypothetical protein